MEDRVRKFKETETIFKFAPQEFGVQNEPVTSTSFSFNR